MPQPDSSHPTFRRPVVTGLILAVLCGALAFLAPLKISEAPPAKKPRDLQVLITPSTFVVESRREFRMKAVHDFDSPCDRIAASIADLQWQQTFTRKELFDGVASELNPKKTGAYQLLFTCDGREIGSGPISVVVPPAAGARLRYTWHLSAGKPRYTGVSFYCIPITVAGMVSRRDAEPVPRSVSQDTHFKIRDLKAQAPTPMPDLVIAKNTAQADPICISFPVNAEYSLVAYDPDGRASNRLDLAWRVVGPSLQLTVQPSHVEAYATNISPAKVRVYLTSDGGEIAPPKLLNVLFTTPPTVKSAPPDRLALSPDNPLAYYEAAALAGSTKADIEFSEPTMRLRSTTSIDFLSTTRFVFFATFCGLIGVIAGRGSAVFRQPWYLAAGELFTAIIAALILYEGILLGRFPDLGLGPLWLTWPAAAFAGIVGGYTGLGVFKAAQWIKSVLP